VSGGRLYDVRDVASKIADNAARIAVLFEYFENGPGKAISHESFKSAAQISAWHLDEAHRFFGELVLPEDQADAARLDRWLVDYCCFHKRNIISRREVQRNVTPVKLRQKNSLDIALVALVETDRIKLIAKGNRKEIHINPALLSF